MIDVFHALRTRTLTRDLLLGTTFTIVAVVTLSGLLMYAYSIQRHAEALKHEADDLSTQLAKLLAQPLWNVNPEGAAQIGRVYAARTNVVYLHIVDEEGRLIFEFTLPAEARTNDVIQRTRPIMHNGYAVGTVTLALSLTRMQAENRAILTALSLTGLLLIVALLGLILWVFRRFLHRPLTLLAENLHHIARGDYSQRLALLGLADLDAIIQAVNTMTTAIQERDERLHRINEELEARVAQRTSELEEKNAALEIVNAELERFTYTVSHDLKTPLVTIKGFLGLLERDIATGNTARIREDLQHIGNAADRMQQLLEDLLELSRAGRLMNPPAAVPLHEPVRQALEQVGTHHHRVTFDVPPELPTVWADRDRLAEVFQNLIENAIKFMGDQPAPRVEIRATCNAHEVLCSVRDNGIGIDPAYHENIFELFNRLDPNVEGTGVGLAVVKRIIEGHGGRIWVESEGRGHGACFRFTLPIPPEDAPPAGRDAGR
ncbi:HAMP domain-containing protein [Rhodocaloribacter litoris]|uniref:sensor histidine kinase n=1 Tax=Rhodocaloribacter litoris TaxID=2558931 RepID=UPI001421A7D8|nr:ATP-binding protein [Rhodocaloribacter litoris]QXD14036.1 HAMP domain-containing protein [Rhodocaloribacter litoris]